MEDNMIKLNHLLKELTLLFDLECNLDTVLSALMYFINRTLESERSSVFLYQPWSQNLSVFASLDLVKDEIRIPKSSGVIGWVFEHREPVIVCNAYADGRFYKGVDELTGFHTRNMICSPLIDNKKRCLGTLQSLNRQDEDFSINDLELLNLIARMIAVAIINNRRYTENRVASEARKKCIGQFVTNIDNAFEKPWAYCI